MGRVGRKVKKKKKKKRKRKQMVQKTEGKSTDTADDSVGQSSCLVHVELVDLERVVELAAAWTVVLAGLKHHAHRPVLSLTHILKGQGALREDVLDLSAGVNVSDVDLAPIHQEPAAT